MYEHGIHTIEAEYVAHVCTDEGGLYIFPTESARSVADSFPSRDVYRNGRKTASGRIVPVPKIDGVSCLSIPPVLSVIHDPKRKNNTSDKGRCAENIVKAMSDRGQIEGFKGGSQIGVQDPRQYKGVDMEFSDGKTLEIKLDSIGGLSGTGALFIQTHEVNYNNEW